MCRYRKIENLLEKHHELEKQETYFSDIASLNVDLINAYKLNERLRIKGNALFSLNFQALI